jgi:DNA-binding NtrC family response regulator
MVARDEFREDLYYRLKGFLISLPPLRRRAEDLPLLLQHFLARFNRELGKQVESFAPEAMESLCSYSWPGNVRELENVIKQSLLNSTGAVLLAEFLPALPADPPLAETASAEAGDTTNLAGFIGKRLHAGTERLYAEAVEFLEQRLLTCVLSRTRGNQSHAARILGITRGSLRNKVRSLGISIDRVVCPPEQEFMPAPSRNSYFH